VNGTTVLHTCLLYWKKPNILSLYHSYGGNVRIVFKKCYECFFFFFKFLHYGDKENSMWIGWSFFIGNQNAKVAILKRLCISYKK